MMKMITHKTKDDTDAVPKSGKYRGVGHGDAEIDGLRVGRAVSCGVLSGDFVGVLCGVRNGVCAGVLSVGAKVGDGFGVGFGVSFGVCGGVLTGVRCGVCANVCVSVGLFEIVLQFWSSAYVIELYETLPTFPTHDVVFTNDSDGIAPENSHLLRENVPFWLMSKYFEEELK